MEQTIKKIMIKTTVIKAIESPLPLSIDDNLDDLTALYLTCEPFVLFDNYDALNLGLFLILTSSFNFLDISKSKSYFSIF